MTIGQIIVAIIVAAIGSAGAMFGFLQFMIKRKDEKENNDVDKRIAEAVDKAKKEVREDFEKGLLMRGEEGRARFEINSKQIEKNTTQLANILTIVEDQAEKYNDMLQSLTVLAKQAEVSAEGQRSFNYDRILMVANKALKNGKITITAKTNLNQLCDSYKKLGGNDPKIKTLYEECMKLTTIPDEEGE